MAKTVVLKIGGGVLKDKSSFDRVVKIVAQKKANGEKQIIVISALYGVTDFLIESMGKCKQDHKQVEGIINSLKKMHKDYLAFIGNADIRKKAEFVLDDKISLLEKFLYGISYLKEISPRSRDLVQSFGERLSPIVLEAFLLDNKVPAEFIDAEEAGIKCHGQFENALVDLPRTEKNLLSKAKPLLAQKVLLLPGYYGIDDSNDVKTFGRGGTDYSAGFIANIFDAELEIWKDVSGFMTADPKVVPAAKQIDFLNYEEAEELGYLGAKILHPKTIAPMRLKGLYAEVKNIFAPEVKGTLIGPDKHKSDEVVKSIACTKDIAAITVKSSSMVNNPGFASEIFSLLSEKEIAVDMIATSEIAISFTVEAKNLPLALDALKTLENFCPCEITSTKELSLVGAIGQGLRGSPGIAGRLFSALGKENISVELIAQSASEINVSFVVKKNDLEKAIRAVHKEFIA
ncbi:putative aspartokinase [uncultured archaeon]|nr:putative aspartokinase [uncultured archaeon]